MAAWASARVETVTDLDGLAPAPVVARPYPTAVVAAGPTLGLVDELAELVLELVLELVELALEVVLLLELLDDVELLVLDDDELVELALDDDFELLVDDVLDEELPLADAFVPPSPPPPPPHAATAAHTILSIRADFSPEFAAFMQPSSSK